MSQKQYRKELMASLKSAPIADLNEKAKNIKDELFWLKLKNRSEQNFSLKEFRNNKKMLARILTLTNAKKKEEKQGAK